MGAVLFWCVVQYKMDYTSYLCLTRLLQQDTMMNPEAKVPLRCPLLDTVNRTSKFNCLTGLVSPERACADDLSPSQLRGTQATSYSGSVVPWLNHIQFSMHQ